MTTLDRPTMSPSTGPLFRVDPSARAELEHLRRLASELQRGAPEVKLWLADLGDPTDLPLVVVDILRLVVGQLAAGHAVTIIPHGGYLTSSQAAALLGVSRPYLIKLLADEAIPCEWVGAHRRISFDDVMAYRDKRAQQVRSGMTSLLDRSRAVHGDNMSEKDVVRAPVEVVVPERLPG